LEIPSTGNRKISKCTGHSYTGILLTDIGEYKLRTAVMTKEGVNISRKRGDFYTAYLKYDGHCDKYNACKIIRELNKTERMWYT
jgi:hypothetical protein